ncbi:hypothetical protein BsWGS_02172 [Bradybaena similaris]
MMEQTLQLCFFLGALSGMMYRSDADCDPTTFRCTDGKCISMALKCDGENDCPDNSDEKECPSATCSEGFFRCDSGKCISERWVCDDSPDCPDGSDEKRVICNNETCKGYRCKQSSLCLPKEWKCDGQPDCPNKDDEADCNNACDPATEFTCQDKKCIPDRWKCDHHEDCDDGSDEHKCPATDCAAVGESMCNDGTCINDKWWCDGDDDCEDKSDEANCTDKLTNQTCGPTEFQCLWSHLSPLCIHYGWKCDGDPDCSDGSDEISCPGYTCGPEQKMCDKHSCVMLQFFCDGEFDCEDGEDENNCTNTGAEKDCVDHEFDCGNKCISHEKICDGSDDCDNGADEKFGPHCLLANNMTCDKNLGGCDQLCIPNTNMTSGRQCGCHAGFSLIPGSSTKCQDVNECARFGLCSQMCTNTEGSYKCECFTGYRLTNHRYCKANDGNHAALILSSHHEIRRYQLDTYRYSLVLEQEVASAVAIDFDIRNEMLFWTDVESEKVYSANMTSGHVKVIIEDDIRMPGGLAVDWVHNNLYLSDANLDTIQVTKLNGSCRKTLLHKDLDEPRALIVDPSSGWMYWTDWGREPRIEKCGMDGTYRRPIVTKDISWPNGLTIDYVQQRLYWVDAKLHMIGSSDLDGNNYQTILRSHRNLGHPFAITVFEDYLYWTDWMSNAVHKISKFGHDNTSTIALGLKSPMDIHVYHIYRQPFSVNHCGENNGGCSHLCLPVPQFNSSYLPEWSVCACPDHMILDHFTCRQYGALTTMKMQEKYTETISPNSGQSSESVLSLAEETMIKSHEPSVADSAVNTSYIQTLENKESVGSVAGIVIITLIVVGLFIFVVIFMLLKRHKSRNVKSFNFDNPVYRKSTTEEQLIMDKNTRLSQSMRPSNLSSDVV